MTEGKVAVIIPAHNEERRIGAVLNAVLGAPCVDRVIVVSDGSTDGTAQVAASFPNVHVEVLQVNQGKGGAMLRGAQIATDASILLFLDGDLIGINPSHVEALVAPLVGGRAQMALGVFRGGRGLTDLAQFLVPYITGQRAIRRSLFLAIPDLDKVGYGIEMAITMYVRSQRLKVATAVLDGVTHPMKEEKLGFLRGAWARTRMYYEMGRFTASYFVRGRPPRYLEPKDGAAELIDV